MKAFFVVCAFLCSVSLIAQPTGTSGPTETSKTSTTPTSDDGTPDTIPTSEPTITAVTLDSDGYKVEFKEFKAKQKIQKALTKAAIKEDAKNLGLKIQAIIKGCKAKTVKDYNSANTCFYTKIALMDSGKHKFILSTIVAQCETAWTLDGSNKDPYTAQNMAQRKYLCYRNALRAQLKTTKGLVIGWGSDDEQAPYSTDMISCSNSRYKQCVDGEPMPE